MATKERRLEMKLLSIRTDQSKRNLGDSKDFRLEGRLKQALCPCLLLTTLLLSGCSSYKSSFDCPAGVGVGCRSVSEVDALVEKGALTYKSVNHEVGTEFDDLHSTHLQISNYPLPLSKSGPHIQQPDSQRLKVWIAGYEDQEGTYHDPRIVHLSVRGKSE